MLGASRSIEEFTQRDAGHILTDAEHLKCFDAFSPGSVNQEIEGA